VAAQSLASVADYRLGSGSELPSRLTGSGEPLLAEIRQRYTATAELARRLENLRGGQTAAGDAETLEGRLETIRRLLEADTPYRVYYTAQDGFDTHASQFYTHQRLLQTLGKALAGFLDGLKPSKLDERVVVLVFSEFGRRLKENANGGTDHGAAAPVLMPVAPSREASSAHTPTWPISTRPAIPVSPSISATSTRHSSAVGWTSTRRRSWANAKQRSPRCERSVGPVCQQKGLSARRIELASVMRSLGSRARHCPMTIARGFGTSGRRARIGTGCSSKSMRIRSPPPAGSS